MPRCTFRSNLSSTAPFRHISAHAANALGLLVPILFAAAGYYLWSKRPELQQIDLWLNAYFLLY